MARSIYEDLRIIHVDHIRVAESRVVEAAMRWNERSLGPEPEDEADHGDLEDALDAACDALRQARGEGQTR